MDLNKRTAQRAIEKGHTSAAVEHRIARLEKGQADGWAWFLGNWRKLDELKAIAVMMKEIENEQQQSAVGGDERRPEAERQSEAEGGREASVADAPDQTPSAPKADQRQEAPGRDGVSAAPKDVPEVSPDLPAEALLATSDGDSPHAGQGGSLVSRANVLARALLDLSREGDAES